MMSRSQVWCSVSEELRAPRPQPQPLPGLAACSLLTVTRSTAPARQLAPTLTGNLDAHHLHEKDCQRCTLPSTLISLHDSSLLPSVDVHSLATISFSAPHRLPRAPPSSLYIQHAQLNNHPPETSTPISRQTCMETVFERLVMSI